MRFAGLLILGTLACGADEFRVERVFGPETQTGAYKHPASIAALRNGDLYLAYYGGDGEYAVDTGVFGSRKKKGQEKWSTPVRVAHDPFRSVGNAVVWEAPDGVVWLFYVVRYGKTWSTSRIQAKVSKDGAETWSDSFVIAQDEGMMVRNRPIVLASGEYLLPVYHETGNDTEVVGAESTSRFLRFDPNAREWNPSGIIRSSKGNIQPGVVALDAMRLIAYCRRGGGYGPVRDGFMIRAESGDGGRTWSEGKNAKFPNPNSAIDFLRLASGALMLVYNDSMSGRTPLTAALSEDGDRTWPHRKNLRAQEGESFAYPYAAQSADGRIHVVYTTKGRSVIEVASFDEAWLKGR